MTKNDIIEQVSEETGLTRSQATKAVESTLAVMKSAFIRRKDIFLRGFGTFQVVERKGKTARDITRGTQMVVPRHHVVKFKPCNDIKNKVK